MNQTRDPMAELTSLRDQSVAYDADKHDHGMQSQTMNFNKQGQLELPVERFGQLPPVDLTDHAKRQLYAKLGPGHYQTGGKALPFDYLEAHTPAVRAILLNGHVKSPRVAEREYLLRCYQEQGRAVLHGNYPVVPNTQLLDSVLESINGKPPEGMRVYRPYLDPDRVILRILWKNTGRPDGGGGTYGLGAFLQNDEIGGGRVKIWPLIQESSCTNSIVFRPMRNVNDLTLGEDKNYDEETDTKGDFIGLSLIHRGDTARLTFMVKEAIGQSLNAGAEYLDKLIAAETRNLPDFTDLLDKLTDKYRWSEDTKTAVAIGTRGQETLAGLVSGVTFAAQRLENPVDQVDMETLGGTILVNADSLFGHARAVRGIDIYANVLSARAPITDRS